MTRYSATVLALAFVFNTPHHSRAFGQPLAPNDRLAATFDFIFAQHDLFHEHFYVYRDRDAGDQHYFPSGWMGDFSYLNVTAAPAIIDDSSTDGPYSGPTCIKLHYPRNLIGPERWGGISWEFPDRNWAPSEVEVRGYDLRRYAIPGETVQLTFYARGANGGERAEFRIGGWEFESLRPAVGTDGQLGQFVQPIVLSKQWKQYRIDLTARDLSNSRSGFSWVTNHLQNPGGCTIYLDEIRFEFGPQGRLKRLSEPRFVRSYLTVPDAAKDMYFRNASFSYDNALVVLACCARGGPEDLRHAQLICNAFLDCQRNDPFQDGRIRNTYSCGDLTDPYLRGRPRLPGWWDDQAAQWYEDNPYFVSTDTGNMAWVALALITFWEANGKQGPYLQGAESICNWIQNHAICGKAVDGYCGGVEVIPASPEHPDGQRWLTFRSTEHNIDLYVVFCRMARATRDLKWCAAAQNARHFVESMIDPRYGFLLTGEENGQPNRSVFPLDVNPWALLAFQDRRRYERAVRWAGVCCRVTTGDPVHEAWGFDFNTDRDGVWWEGTAQMCLAYQALGDLKQARWCLEALRRHGVADEPRGAVLAASVDQLTTGFERSWGPWVYWKRPQTGGSSCWYIFTELGWNPYWGTKVARLGHER